MVDIDILKHLTNYGTFEIKLKSFNDSDLPSDDVITSYTINGAKIMIKNFTKIKIVKNITGVTLFELLIDDIVKDIINYDDSVDWEYDLSVYTDIPNGRHKVNLRAIDVGINVNLSNDVYYYLGEAPIYGASGLSTSTPTLQRTDDAVDFTYTINNQTGEIFSDFDLLFPWNETEIVEDVAGKFLKFPEMYFRVGVDGSLGITDIAVSPTAHGVGDWYRVPPFMYGCYGASLVDNKLRSDSNAIRANAITRANSRIYAANNGSNYHQLDLYHVTVLAFLFWIEFNTRDSRSIMTGRYKNSGSEGGMDMVATGRTDILTTPSGYEFDYMQMRYHYIEDYVGNIFEFVDGVVCTGRGSKNYVTNDPSKFSDSSTNLSQLAYTNPTTSHSYATTSSIGWDSTNPFMVLPLTTVSNINCDTYFCQRNKDIGRVILFFGHSYITDLIEGGNFSFFRCNLTSVTKTMGARLLKKL